MDPDPSSILLDYNLIIGCAVIVILLLFSALISGTEAAVFSLTPEDIKKIAQKSTKKGKLLVTLLEKPKKLLATIVISNTFLNIAIIILFFRLGDNLFSGIASAYLRIGVEVAVITFTILLFGEVVPKVYATRNNSVFSARVAYMLFVLSKLLATFSIPMR